MNDRFYNLYLHREISRIKPGAVFFGGRIINTLSDDRLLRMRGNYSTSRKVRTWRILSQVITREFSTSQSIPYIAHVDAEVLCDEVRNFLLEMNQIKSRALLQIKKKPIFRKID